MLAASKVLAAMSDNRNVPRDVFDLNDLAGADPTEFLAERVDAQELELIAKTAFDKIHLINFAQAQTELLPYLPADIRDAQTECSWDEMILLVADCVSTWARSAIELQQTAALDQSDSARDPGQRPS